MKLLLLILALGFIQPQPPAWSPEVYASAIVMSDIVRSELAVPEGTIVTEWTSSPWVDGVASSMATGKPNSSSVVVNLPAGPLQTTKITYTARSTVSAPVGVFTTQAPDGTNTALYLTFTSNLTFVPLVYN